MERLVEADLIDAELAYDDAEAGAIHLILASARLPRAADAERP